MNGLGDRNQQRAPGRPRTPGLDIKPGDVRMGGPSMSLTELTAAAGVSTRTVRYYIAEGLLPPPVGAGPKSAYSPAHLDRLRLINRLKDAYLPLREIRRQLAGLSDEAVRQMLAEVPPAPAVENPATLAESPSERPLLDSAAAYIEQIRRQQREAPPAAMPLMAAPMPAAGPAQAKEPPPGATWRRVPLAEGVELLMREDVYQRRPDRVEWLVRWARRVFA